MNAFKFKKDNKVGDKRLIICELDEHDDYNYTAIFLGEIKYTGDEYLIVYDAISKKEVVVKYGNIRAYNMSEDIMYNGEYYSCK